MSSTLRKAGAMTTALVAAGAAIAVGGAQLASAGTATATTGVNIRSGPGTKYKIIGGLDTGQRITAISKPSNGWVKVQFNGSSAYVSAQYLNLKNNKTAAPASIYTKGVKLATAPLNVRSGPSLGSKVIGYLSNGEKVSLTGKQSKGFVEILYGGARAWASSQYLVSSMNDLPKDTGSRYATADLLIRTSTDSDFKIITTVKKGSELHTTGTTSNGYAQIIYGNAVRWVTAKYLSNQTVSGPSSSTSSSSTSSSSKSSSSTSSSSKSSSSKSSSSKSTSHSSTPKVVGSRYATTELLIRTTSGSNFRTVTEVPTGTKLQITGKTAAGKAQVVYDGVARWVTAQYLATTKPSTHSSSSSSSSTPSVPKTIGTRYATTELLIRTTSGSDYKTVDSVPTGTKLKITGHYSNGRAQIVYNGSVRWVTSQYLATSKPSSNSGSSSSSSGVSYTGGSSSSSSNRGVIALNYAKAQLGKPYVFGATGPSTFDCSGLVLRAWQAAGVNLPRTSQQQFLASPRVSLSNLKLGDLVFFYGPSPSHVGIYAGNGKVINAPRPGKTVEYTAISYMPVAGATRPG